MGLYDELSERGQRNVDTHIEWLNRLLYDEHMSAADLVENRGRLAALPEAESREGFLQDRQQTEKEMGLVEPRLDSDRHLGSSRGTRER